MVRSVEPWLVHEFTGSSRTNWISGLKGQPTPAMARVDPSERIGKRETYRCERSTVPRSCSGLIADGWLCARTAIGNAILRHPSASTLLWSPVRWQCCYARTIVSGAIFRFAAEPEARCSAVLSDGEDKISGP